MISLSKIELLRLVKSTHTRTPLKAADEAHTHRDGAQREVVEPPALAHKKEKARNVTSLLQQLIFRLRPRLTPFNNERDQPDKMFRKF